MSTVQEPIYKCSICGHRTDEGEHSWGQTSIHFWREIVMGEKMELILVRRGE